MYIHVNIVVAQGILHLFFVGTKPNRRSKLSETFQTGSDGKLIIYDEDEENIEGVSGIVYVSVSNA